ncbi:MAG: hypothetical protein E6G08_17325 [Actinobacteria bacterium]|nr:MAG: hypothetical protein E6G08_17325 [Actinomycetota bacterium]
MAVIVAGCGSSGKTQPGPPPTAQELVRSSLLAAAESPGATYDLVIDAKLSGALPKRLRSYVRTAPHARATGTIARDLFVAHVSSSIPAIAIVTGDEIAAGRDFAYLRYRETWYGSGTHGLVDFWRRLPSLALGRPATRDELFALLEGAIHGSVTAGPSRDGTETWELAGTVDPAALKALLRPFTGYVSGLHVTQIAARLRAIYDVGRDDFLPRRLRIELHAVRPDLGTRLEAQLPDLHGVDAVIELELTGWGKQTPVQRPANPKTYDQYLDRLGLGG